MCAGGDGPLPPQRLECRAESVGPTRDKSKSHRAPSLEAALVGGWARTRTCLQGLVLVIGSPLFIGCGGTTPTVVGGTKRPDDALVLITAETDQNQLRRRGTTAPCYGWASGKSRGGLRVSAALPPGRPGGQTLSENKTSKIRFANFKVFDLTLAVR